MRCLYLLLLCAVAISGVFVARDKRKEVCMIDLVIVVDRSGSIVKDDKKSWTDVQDFLKNIVGSYTIGEDDTKIALVTFSNDAKVEFGFDEKNMDDKIDKIRDPMGYTATASALEEALHVLKQGRSGSSKVVLLVTDGLPTKNKEGNTIEDGDEDDETLTLRKEYIQEVINEGNLIRRSTGAKILAFGVTEHVNSALFLEDLADPGSYFKSDRFDDLKRHVQDITENSCKTVLAGRCTMDVAFAVDMSGSVANNSDTLKNFLDTLNDQLEKMDPRIHTALIRFANKARIYKPLNAYGPNAMHDAIKSMSGPAGYTATADAFVKAMQLFNGSEADGDRPGKGNVLVLVSDGLPTKALDLTTIESDSKEEQKKIVYDEVLKMATQLKDEYYVQIFSVVIQGKTNTNFELLQRISSGDKPVRVHEFSELMDKISSIKKEICEEIPAKRRREMLKKEEKDDSILKALLRLLLESPDDNEDVEG